MVKVILRVSIPAIVSMFFVMMTEIINTIFIGNLNDQYQLAGVGMGNMTLNILGLSVILGMNSALETVVSQSYGNGNLYMCGVYLNRARLIITICFIPIVFLLI
jgi:Na+-driven multidrug efflux pump